MGYALSEEGFRIRLGSKNQLKRHPHQGAFFCEDSTLTAKETRTTEAVTSKDLIDPFVRNR